MSFLWHLLTPSVPLHELTHAFVALPWATDIDARLSRSDAHVDVTLPEGTPIWAVYAVSMAPTVVGLGVALIAIALFGVPSVTTLSQLAIHELGLLVILALNWAIFTYPSEGDRRPLR
ncbi:hypothetical protein C5B91_20115 [Haloferax sp. Atlit-10N]|uniref:hypothetical protein n=1 Tax=unclassified Haloferax TaxID=2625095 RepID=UPI000E22CC66|nr:MULTISPECIES: hypothetical protein [unclassified Haloferax]RDZ39402.1 hypothetical protein C5B87_19375 [Haloferax sp. Atlit-16N]RDZ53917.1 hypothetical protein C5B91_20115 [Haloferax sp. Atlit-10N]